jgi:hypothetical protein
VSLGSCWNHLLLQDEIIPAELQLHTLSLQEVLIGISQVRGIDLLVVGFSFISIWVEVRDG